MLLKAVYYYRQIHEIQYTKQFFRVQSAYSLQSKLRHMIHAIHKNGVVMVPAGGCEITVFGLNKRCSENRPLVLDIVQMTSTYSSNLIS